MEGRISVAARELEAAHERADVAESRCERLECSLVELGEAFEIVQAKVTILFLNRIVVLLDDDCSSLVEYVFVHVGLFF